MKIWGTDHQIRKVYPKEQRIASQEAIRFFRREADARAGGQAVGSPDVHSDHVDSGFTEA